VPAALRTKASASQTMAESQLLSSLLGRGAGWKVSGYARPDTRGEKTSRRYGERKRASIRVIKLGGYKGTNVFDGAHGRTPCWGIIPTADIETRIAVAPRPPSQGRCRRTGPGGCFSKAAAGESMIPRRPPVCPGRLFGGPYRGIHHPKACRCTDYCRAW
jgi:hypothetical protein